MKPELIQDLVEKIDQFGTDHQLRLRFKVDLLKRLAQKLANVTDEDIEDDLQLLADALPTIARQIDQHKNYHIVLKRVKTKAEKRFGYVPTGYLKKKEQNNWVTIGVAIGVAVGSGINQDGTEMGFGIAIGLAIGVALGQSMGNQKEQKASKSGLTY